MATNVLIKSEADANGEAKKSIAFYVKNIRKTETMQIVSAKSLLFENKGAEVAEISVKGQEAYQLFPHETLVIEVQGYMLQNELWTISFCLETSQNHVSVVVCQVN